MTRHNRIVAEVRQIAIDRISASDKMMSSATFSLAMRMLETIHAWENRGSDMVVRKLREVLAPAFSEYVWTTFDCNPEFVRFKTDLQCALYTNDGYCTRWDSRRNLKERSNAMLTKNEIRMAEELEEEEAKKKRYQMFLELKEEFEGATKSPKKKPVKESVYLCKYWEYDDNDPSGCGESWSRCHSEKSGRSECGCGRTYAMQFCPFYEKGKLAGKWVIDDEDKEAAKKFRQEF